MGVKLEIDIIEICKALSNETRLNIMKWLREPEKNFSPQGCNLNEPVVQTGGVCVGRIQAKANLSPSTVSNYLDTLQRAGLLVSERHGKWTYYRRNEAVLQKLSEYIKNEL